VAPLSYNSADDTLLGRLIGEKFKLRSCVGIGASGAVYQADQVALGRTVAVKVLRPDLAQDPRLVKRFQDEAMAASRLNHPNTVSIIDYGQTDDGLLYIIMEFLRGRTLTQILREDSPLAEARIADLMSQVLLGLEEAHAAGIVHADLKADNVVVEQRRGGWELAKVVDFGIARLVGAPEQQNEQKTVCGTPEYMAPEVITGNEPTFSSDLYAAGVLLYELIAGVTPFAHGSPSAVEVLTRHLREAVPPLQTVTQQPVNPIFADAVATALAKEPGQRFASAPEFRAALAEVLYQESRTDSVLCSACGMEGPRSFKYCPDCGHPRTAQRNPVTDAAVRVSAHGSMATRATVFVEQSAVPTASVEVQPRTLTEDGAGIFPLPLVGRDREFNTVRHFVRGDRSHNVLQIVGERGSGRSRMVEEVARELASADITVFLAGPDPTGLASTFYPVRSLLGAMLALPAVCGIAELGAAIAEVGLSQRDLPGVAELFGHPNELSELEAQIRHREVLASAVRAVRAVAQTRALVLVFEDVDRYDAPSLEFLQRLAPKAAGAVPIVLTNYIGRSDEWTDSQCVVLEPLRDDDLEQIASHLQQTGNQAMPSAEMLALHSHGSPEYITQLIRYVIEGGNMQTAPSSLADLIAARAELLPDGARRVLQSVATIGIECTTDDLHQTLDHQSEQSIQDALAVLTARDLLVADQDFVWFNHRMVREVVYESIPANARRNLHAAVARLERLGGDPAVVGHHYDRAAMLVQATPALARAGDQALRQLNDAGASDFYNRALRCARQLMLADDDNQLRHDFVEISVKLADSLRVRGAVALGRGLLDEAAQHCHGSPVLAAQLLRAKSHLQSTAGDLAGALATSREAIGLAIAAGNTSALTDLYLDLSMLYLRSGRADHAAAELEECIDLVTLGEGPGAEQGPAQMWHLLVRLAHLYRSLQQSDKARRIAEHALVQSRRASSGVGVARSQALLAEICEQLTDFDAARTYRQSAVEELRRLGDRRGTAELLLAGAEPTRSFMRISPTSLREARDLADEVGWTEGIRRADGSQPRG
jgi:eukaryotic-like serine/threonine-protein kinase